jgi:hypothetical protein
MERARRPLVPLLFAAALLCALLGIARGVSAARGAELASDAASASVEQPVVGESLPDEPEAAREGRAPKPSHASPRRDLLAERQVRVAPVAIVSAPSAPLLGVGVPSVLSITRWCVAHATATSPA